MKQLFLTSLKAPLVAHTEPSKVLTSPVEVAQSLILQMNLNLNAKMMKIVLTIFLVPPINVLKENACILQIMIFVMMVFLAQAMSVIQMPLPPMMMDALSLLLILDVMTKSIIPKMLVPQRMTKQEATGPPPHLLIVNATMNSPVQETDAILMMRMLWMAALTML